MTLIVILFGAVVLVLALARDDRGRRVALEEIETGMSVAQVDAAIGAAAVRCPAGELTHLETSFPEGWPASLTFAAAEWLRSETSDRLLYPVDDGPVACDEDTDRSEVGIDSAGAVVWSTARVGRTPLQLPPWLTPEAVAEREEAVGTNPE